MLLYPIHLAGLQILRPVLTLLFQVQQMPCFILASLVRLTFQVHSSSAILIYYLDEIFMSKLLTCNGGQ